MVSTHWYNRTGSAKLEKSKSGDVKSKKDPKFNDAGRFDQFNEC